MLNAWILTSALLYLAGKADPHIRPGIIPGSVINVIKKNKSVMNSSPADIIERISPRLIYQSKAITEHQDLQEVVK